MGDVIAVSYTHLDVYKRQEQINTTFVSTLTQVLTESGEMLSQTDGNGVDIVSVTTDKLDGIDKNLQTYVDILNTFSLVTGSASDLADSAQTLILNTQGLFNSSQDTVSSCLLYTSRCV